MRYIVGTPINPEAHTILVKGASAENDYTDIYAVGDFGSGWSEDNASYRYDANYADCAVETETPMEVLAMTGDAYAWKVEAGSYNMILDIKNMTLVVSKASGISSINGDNAAAEYYTIQGVRVDNPTTGIYIVRRGNTVTKTYIK